MELRLVSPKYGEKIVFIDPEDEKLIINYTWNISYVRGNWYAVHSYFINGKSAQIKMHRLIMGVTNPDIKVDHIDHYGLNNVRKNLRLATIGQNNRNVGITKANKTGYKGVF